MNFNSFDGSVPNGELSGSIPSSPRTPEDAPTTTLDHPPPVPRRSAPQGFGTPTHGLLPSNMADTASTTGSPATSQSSSSNASHGRRRRGTSSGTSSRRNASQGRN